MKKRPRKTNQARRTQEEQHAAATDWSYIAQEAFERRHYTEAEQAARRALRIEPGHLHATLLLAELLHRTSKHRELLGLVREGLRHHPKDPRLQFALADTALALGELQDAERAAQRFDELLDRGSGALGDETSLYVQRIRRIQSEVDRRKTGRSAAPVRVRGSRPAIQPTLFDSVEPGTHVSRPGRRTLERAPAAGGTAAGDAARSRGAPRRPSAARLVRPRDPAPQAPPAAPGADTPRTVVPELEASFEADPAAAAEWFAEPASSRCSDDLEARQLLLESQRIVLLSKYEDLLCLPTLQGVEQHEFQIETARKILRRLSGRALLCDEVGLGKTIEAGMVIKEYLLRGLVRSVLVLVPPGLVQQWQDEMSQKFGLAFAPWSAGDGQEAQDGATVLAIGSIAYARHERNFAAFAEREWDMVVVDEAHHLRRRTTRSWALVNSLRKRYVLLLSATPVHNDLMELYELVTLVKPGLLGTPAEFRRRFVGAKKDHGARQPDRLRELLAEVMVRNTRSHADVVLPRRFAATLVLKPHEAESRAYAAASEYARLAFPGTGMTGRSWLRHLLGCAGSGPRAVAETAARRLGRATHGAQADAESLLPPTGLTEPPDAERLLRDIVTAAESASSSTKTDHLLEMLAGSSEQIVVFCRYRATLGELTEKLGAAGVECVLYHGGLSRQGKDAAIERFRAGARVLLTTESGGEGRNIHFCHTLVNYDLPWDPMLLEQRIGRLHRIGQKRDVFVFNLVLAGTLEEELLRILEEKIHLFELIVGEVDSILGHLERREEFAEILLDLWAGARDDSERRQRFEAFGNELAAARASYEGEKSLGDSLFADELEV